MGTTNSSAETRSRSQTLAGQVGSSHLTAVIDPVVEALKTLFVTLVGKEPRFRAHGGAGKGLWDLERNPWGGLWGPYGVLLLPNYYYYQTITTTNLVLLPTLLSRLLLATVLT
jgi:hypothetical protein